MANSCSGTASGVSPLRKVISICLPARSIFDMKSSNLRASSSENCIPGSCRLRRLSAACRSTSSCGRLNSPAISACDSSLVMPSASACMPRVRGSWSRGSRRMSGSSCSSSWAVSSRPVSGPPVRSLSRVASCGAWLGSWMMPRRLFSIVPTSPNRPSAALAPWNPGIVVPACNACCRIRAAEPASALNPRKPKPVAAPVSSPSVPLILSRRLAISRTLRRMPVVCSRIAPKLLASSRPARLARSSASVKRFAGPAGGGGIAGGRGGCGPAPGAAPGAAGGGCPPPAPPGGAGAAGAAPGAPVPVTPTLTCACCWNAWNFATKASNCRVLTSISMMLRRAIQNPPCAARIR